MRDDQVNQCIDYIRFTMEVEGSELADGTRDVLESILTGDADADSVVADYIVRQGLETSYEAGHDEMGTYEDSRALVNYFNIHDKARLRTIEHFLVNVRTAQLFACPLSGNPTFQYLCQIHSRLFGDIYPSAGRIRTSEASKRKDFCRVQFIERCSSELFARLSKDDYLRKIDDVGDFANDLAFYMGEAEALHPFRDGNGRAIRFYFNRLVQETGYLLHWSKADPDRMLEASIAAIDGDYQALVDVLGEILEPCG